MVGPRGKPRGTQWHQGGRDRPRRDARHDERLPAELIQAARERLVQLREQVAVAVERDGDRRVAEPLLDGLGMSAEGDAERGAGVSQVVEATRPGSPAASQQA